MASIYDPSYSTIYDPGMQNEFTALSTLSVGSYKDARRANSLTVGSTSNEGVKAMQGIRSYINTSNSYCNWFFNCIIICVFQLLEASAIQQQLALMLPVWS